MDNKRSKSQDNLVSAKTYYGESRHEDNTVSVSYLGETLEVDSGDLCPSEPRYDD